jgi:hypothetical protein
MIFTDDLKISLNQIMMTLNETGTPQANEENGSHDFKEPSEDDSTNKR